MDNFQSPVPEYMLGEASRTIASIHEEADVCRLLRQKPSFTTTLICAALRRTGAAMLRVSDYLMDKHTIHSYRETKHAV